MRGILSQVNNIFPTPPILEKGVVPAQDVWPPTPGGGSGSQGPPGPPGPPGPNGPWQQIGELISPFDQTAGVSFGAEGGNTAGAGAFAFGVEANAVNQGDVAWGRSTASGGPSFAAFVGADASGNNSMALLGGNSDGQGSFAVGLEPPFSPSLALGVFSVAFAAGHAINQNDVAFHANSVASGSFSFAATEGLSSGYYGTAFGAGQAASPGVQNFAHGAGSIATGDYAAAFASGSAEQEFDFAVGMGSVAQGGNSIAFAGGAANEGNDFAVGAGSIAAGG